MWSFVDHILQNRFPRRDDDAPTRPAPSRYARAVAQAFGPTFPCPRCSAPLPAGAAFCNRCGADARAAAALAAQAPPPMRARPGFVAVGRGMSVCHGCGALAPTQRTSCEVCTKPLGSSLEAVPARADALSFVQLRTTVTCRQCGSGFPLDEPELGEAVTCPRCNTLQAFDLEVWGEAFAHAHLVGDVYGPRGAAFRQSLGHDDPSPGLGRDSAVSEITRSGMTMDQGVMRTRNLRACCAPGQPLCDKCGSPREPSETRSARGEPELELRCVGCGDTARYATPPIARVLAPSLVGIVAEALRVDRPEAQLDKTSAGMVIALRCPSCGGGLHVTPGSHVAVCSFCKTEARIASRTLLALKSVEAEPQPWWAIFRGDAASRSTLVRRHAPTPSREQPHDDSLESRLLVLQTLAEGPGGAKAIQEAIAAKVKDPEDDLRPHDTRREWALQLVLPAIAVAIVSPLFYQQALRWIDAARTVTTAPAASSPPPYPGALTATNTATPSAAAQPIVIMLEHEGIRRPVCDDSFGLPEANVACRQLGYTAASGFSTVRGDTDDFWLDDLDCEGTEARLEDCRHRGWGVENCTAPETQAVTCF